MNIKEIAQRAGVSTATVSRMLNKNGYVKDETRQRIQTVIDECGYMPSAVARSLSVQKTHNIGFITPDIANPFNASVLAGVTQVADSEAYNVFVFDADETPEKEHRILEIVQEQRLEGIAISPVKANDERSRMLLEEINWHVMPVVQFDRRLQNADISSVLADNEQGAYLAVKQLIQEGHRKIGLVEGDGLNWAVKERIFGYCRALVEADIPIRSEYMAPASQRLIEKSYDAASYLLGLEDPPTAIFTCNNNMTLGCIKYFTEKGMVLGRDISLIGFDDVETLNLVGYAVSAVDQSGLEMGRRTMEMLLGKIRSEGKSNEHIRVPVKLVLRGSEKLAAR